MFTSEVCSLGARGFIHVLNHEKNCVISDFKVILLNLQQMNNVIVA